MAKKSDLRLALEDLYRNGKLGASVIIRMSDFARTPKAPTAGVAAIANLVGGPSWATVRHTAANTLVVTKISTARRGTRERDLKRRREESGIAA